MTHPIFTTAREAAALLEADGHDVELTTHPTSWGNSAYLTATARAGLSWWRRGLRLSDHDVGDFRQLTDELPTVLYTSRHTAQALYDALSFSDNDLADLAERERARVEQAEIAERAAAEKEAARKSALTAENAFNEQMFEVRSRFFRRYVHSFASMTKTKQRPLVKAFNKTYRSRHVS